MKRRGFSLVELLIGLSLFALVGALLVRTTLQLSRGVDRVERRAAALAALDQGSAWLASEIGELAPGDLSTLATDAVRYRSLRVAGLACAVSAAEVRVIAQSLLAGRAPQPGRDSLQLYTGAQGDSGWIALPILDVSPATCDGAPATRLGTLVDSITLSRLAQLALIPARIFERMQTRFYSSTGKWWLGARSESASEGLQPLAGPFAVAGVQLSGLDSLALATSDPAAVRHYRIRLKTETPFSDSAQLYLMPANLRP
jgi:prepilin-type N-terminal cleavage/methylation domain-containing protein